MNTKKKFRQEKLMQMYSLLDDIASNECTNIDLLDYCDDVFAYLKQLEAL